MEAVRIVMVNAVPLPDTEAFAKYGGATINVYTTEQTEGRALVVATREVLDAGWQIKSIEDTFLVTRDDFIETKEGLEYFEQTLIDGIVLVIYSYPATPEDDDIIH
jgi:hypothetical protein